MKQITLEVSEDHESTSYPWWMIVDPKQNMSRDPGTAVMSQITGPFFSRDEAQDFLDRTRYNFSDRAVVWCHSGVDSRKYVEAHSTSST